MWSTSVHPLSHDVLAGGTQQLGPGGHHTAKHGEGDAHAHNQDAAKRLLLALELQRALHHVQGTVHNGGKHHSPRGARQLGDLRARPHRAKHSQEGLGGGRGARALRHLGHVQPHKQEGSCVVHGVQQAVRHHARQSQLAQLVQRLLYVGLLGAACLPLALALQLRVERRGAGAPEARLAACARLHRGPLVRHGQRPGGCARTEGRTAGTPEAGVT
mmetsp:Transcript_15681/g.39115  ORF Transcript_15681/g.39115 Transcript_15681/m.39115 type:complete len:216 (+) Transcript_15681:1781-2428(+)